jgi:DNA-binding NtrC family response regulator
VSRQGSEGDLTTVSEGSDEPSGPPPLYVVRVVAGPDNGRSLVLDWNKTPRVLIGKSAASDLVLTDVRVSRRHLALEPRGHNVHLVDLGATNGTHVSGVRVLEVVLKGGETFEIGDTSIRLVRAGHLSETPAQRGRFGRVIGQSQEMQRVFAIAERLSPSPLPLLIEGDTGTGKALLAEAIHDAGPRARGPFVVFDCGAYGPDEQLVALFGRENPGAIEQASGGTLVLDEVGDLSEIAQSRLVGVLERGLVQRATGGPPRQVDLRVLSTTRHDLEAQIDEGTFREELLFRLTGARIALPPLRVRHGDVERLARHFWSMFGGAGELPKAFAIQLSRHEWPGNVRELEHAVARRVTIGDDWALAAAGHEAGQGDPIDRVIAMNLAMPHARQVIIEEFEQRYVAHAISVHGGNVSRAAAASGVTRRYFHMLRSKKKK